jgi:7,8-dihydro-6-hydroxymethylpterin-pyrophosphokinase
MIFIALGSSIGNAKEIFASTEKLLNQVGIWVTKKSNLFENPPHGGIAKNKFTNAVWQIDHNRPLCKGGLRGIFSKIKIIQKYKAKQLLKQLQNIEDQRGRTRKARWGDRTLDLDILIYHDLICSTPTLTIPHPEIANRDFVLKPWLEIVDKDFSIPHLGKLQKLIKALNTNS